MTQDKSKDELIKEIKYIAFEDRSGITYHQAQMILDWVLARESSLKATIQKLLDMNEQGNINCENCMGKYQGEAKTLKDMIGELELKVNEWSTAHGVILELKVKADADIAILRKRVLDVLERQWNPLGDDLSFDKFEYYQIQEAIAILKEGQ